MSKLTDTHLVILSTAAGRDDGTVLPLAASLKLKGGAVTATLNSLLKKGLLAEVPATPDQAAWRQENDRPLTLLISDAGRAAIGVEVEGTEPDQSDPDASAQTEPPSPSRDALETSIREKVAALSTAGTKQALMVILLCRKEGATLDELVAETRWQPHTTRAALTRLRQKGISISRTVEDGRGSVYRILEASE